MKKSSVLFWISGITISALLLCSNLLRSKITSVEIEQVVPESVEYSVVCSGKVEYGEIIPIYHNSSAIVKEVKVHPGDKVSKGDKIISVNNLTSPAKGDPLINNPEVKANIPEQDMPGMEDMYKEFLQQNKTSPSVSVNSNLVADSKVFNITAPESGTIISVNTKIGETICNTSPLISISPEGNMQVRMSVGESQIDRIKEGQPVKITGTGFKSSEYTGKINNISNEAKQAMFPSGSETVIETIVNLENPDSGVKPGFSAKCKIITESEENVLVVPFESILHEQNGRDYVYIYNKGFARKTFISSEKETEKGIKISCGIEPGQHIIKNPEKIKGDTARVNPILKGKE